MKNILLILVLLCPSLGFAIKAHHISMGSQMSFPLSSDRVWIENSKVIKGEHYGTKLKITALAEGSSFLKIGPETLRIFVVHPQEQQTYLTLRKLLEKKLGLQLQYTNGKTTLRGQIFRLQDWFSLAEALKDSESSYVMEAHLQKDLVPKAQEFFDELSRKNGLPAQKIILENSFHILLPEKHKLSEKYKKLFAPYGIVVQENPQSLLIEPTVRVQITVAEVQRSFTQKLGLRWPDSYQAQILPDAHWDFENLTATAQFFESTGNGKILASPNIICRSGKEAEFLAGGEFPIKIMNLKLQDVVWKKYGILLKVKPTADAQGQMSIQIDSEISTLDEAKSVDGIPGLLTHRVSSYFDMRSPKTIVLSGLIKNERGRTSEGLPWMSRLPVLGALFSSKDFRENRSELVIFVRPEVINLEEQKLEAPQHLSEGGSLED